MFEIVDYDYDRLFLLKDNITSQNIETLNQALDSFILEDERDVILDLEDVTKMDSVALAFFIRAKKRLTENHRGFKMINLSEPVQKILILTGVEAFLTE
jgi:anti-anti-sigma factor